jgi:hypothetical protein
LEDPIKLGLYVLLILPGFIFVQTREYHLLREKRSQFEKTLEILLWSAAIWMIACAIPWSWPFLGRRGPALDQAQGAFRYFAQGASPDWPEILTADTAVFFGSVCWWVFVAANVWGYFRKSRGVNGLIRFVTGRDWYPSVPLKFFEQNVDRVVIVRTPEYRYLGTLHSGPDTKDDPYLILSEVAYFLPPDEKGPKLKPLPGVRWVLIKFSDIVEIQALTDAATERTQVAWWPGRAVDWFLRRVLARREPKQTPREKTDGR